jgi:hypothetical protein
MIKRRGDNKQKVKDVGVINQKEEKTKRKIS